MYHKKLTFVNQLYSILIEILFLPPFAVLVSPEPPSTVGVNDTMVLLNPLQNTLGVRIATPNQHTPEELKLISDMRRRNPDDGLVFFWTKLMQRGYKRSIPALWRILRKLSLLPVKPPNPKYIPKPYEPMLYPGQRVQVDVKIVPKSCIVPDADRLQERYYPLYS